eukprot:4685887-Pleurochrysis_carterae.AAC.1
MRRGSEAADNGFRSPELETLGRTWANTRTHARTSAHTKTHKKSGSDTTSTRARESKVEK